MPSNEPCILDVAILACAVGLIIALVNLAALARGF
jgi:hypothetical protein